jgi:hypothetical protein
MARPEPLPVWDRKSQALLQEYLDDHPSTYETRPQRSLTAWLESQPLSDRRSGSALAPQRPQNRSVRQKT